MQQTLIIPYLRSSPLYDARRDLVIHAAESLFLRVTVIEQDDPSAQLLVVTGGLGGPAAMLTIWADYDGGCRCCDYGRPPARGSTLWSGWATPQPGLGSFDWHLDAGVFYSLPRRCGWAVQLVWDAGTNVDVLQQGRLHIMGTFGPASTISAGPGTGVDTESVILTSGGDPITTTSDETITTS